MNYHKNVEDVIKLIILLSEPRSLINLGEIIQKYSENMDRSSSGLTYEITNEENGSFKFIGVFSCVEYLGWFLDEVKSDNVSKNYYIENL